MVTNAVQMINSSQKIVFPETTILQLIEKHSAKLKNYALMLSQNKTDAEDIYQDTVYKILANEHRFEKTSNFFAWSVTIMRNTFLNRHRGMQKVTFTVDAGDMQSGVYCTRNVYNDGESNIQYTFLKKLIGGLNKEKSLVFTLYTEGYSYEEISQKTGKELNSLRFIVFTARKELQQKLKELGFESTKKVGKL